MELPRASTDKPRVIENVLFDPRRYRSAKNDDGSVPTREQAIPGILEVTREIRFTNAHPRDLIE
jgi:hypothetical protein